MDTTTLRGEKTLLELTERLYGRLNGDQQRRAETMLLQANPGLGAIGQLPIGALLAVPGIAGIPVTPDIGAGDPQERMRGQIRTDLEAYRKDLQGAVAEAQQDMIRQLDLVGGDALRGVIGDDRNLADVVNSLIDHLKQRRRELKQRGSDLAEDPLG